MQSLALSESYRQTPISRVYAVQLEHTVWLYMLALPFQLVEILHWWEIPAVTPEGKLITYLHMISMT